MSIVYDCRSKWNKVIGRTILEANDNFMGNICKITGIEHFSADARGGCFYIYYKMQPIAVGFAKIDGEKYILSMEAPRTCEKQLMCLLNEIRAVTNSRSMDYDLK